MASGLSSSTSGIIRALAKIAEGNIHRLREAQVSPGSRYLTFAVSAAIAVLALTGTWDSRVLGRGPAEYRRMTRGSLFLFSAAGVLAYFTKTDVARSYLAIALPLGLLGMAAGHGAWRSWLGRERRKGRMLTDILVVGGAAGARHLAGRLHDSPQSGYRVVGLCMAQEDNPPADPHLPLVGTLDQIPGALRRTGAAEVAVASCDHFGPTEVRRLSWQLEGTGVRLILVPSLVDVAGPRIHIKPIDGLPLMHVEVPSFSGPKLVAKKSLDIAAAFVGLLLLSPLL